MNKIYFFLIVSLSLFSGCKSQKAEKNKIYLDEFYSILNDLIRFRFADASVIIAETTPVFRTMWGNFKVPDSLHRSPPPPWIIYYDIQSFNNQIEKKHIDLSDAKFMYNSIDSTVTFRIDSTRVIIPTISKKKLGIIFKTNSMIEVDKILEKKYGNPFILSVSSPIFNSTFTKALISIYFKNNFVDGEEHRLLLEKKDGKWKLIDN